MSDFSVTLLGTGTPEPLADRIGISTLVRAGDETLLFDCGRGTGLRLHQAEGSYKTATVMFLTHLHSDHVSGIPDLWLTGSIPQMRGREEALRVYGPTGTENLAEHLQLAYSADVEARQPSRDMAGFGPAPARLEAADIAPGLVYDRNGVRVTAFPVEHLIIEPAFGFRVEYGGRSVVLSGDTTYCESMVDNSRGADLVIHEVAAVPEGVDASSPLVNRVVSCHTSPEDAGSLYRRTAPALAVFSHIHYILGATDDDIIAGARRTYQGEMVVGRDLDTFEVGKRSVRRV